LISFVSEWDRLRPIEQSSLSNIILRPPLLRHLPNLNKKPCFERYLETTSSSSSDVICVECSEPIPLHLRQHDVKFCSYECSRKHSVKLNSSSIRRQLFEIEKGVCRICGYNAHGLWERIKIFSPPERYQMLLGSRFKISKKRLESPKEGDFWQADHIKPVSLGGGCASLHNIRTLCDPCHQRETQRLMHDSRNMQHDIADIRDFF